MKPIELAPTDYNPATRTLVPVPAGAGRGGDHSTIDLRGLTFRTLRVLRREVTALRGSATWRCRCMACGLKQVQQSNRLRDGQARCRRCRGSGERLDYSKSWPCWLRYEDEPAAVEDMGSPRMGRPPRDLLEQRFDTLEVVARAENKNARGRGVRWRCVCEDCGEELIAETMRLQEGRIFCPCTGKKPPGLGRPRSRPLPEPLWKHGEPGERAALRIRIARELGHGSPAEVGRRFWQEVERNAAAA
jgi:Zn finger protein HypA/HybF involved in hydrogenase expression